MAYRELLPSDVLPSRYNLTLEPDFERFTFDGVVRIDCEVHVATESISVHAKELVILSAIFTPSDAAAMAATDINVSLKKTIATFIFTEVLPVGQGVLEIKFRGALNDSMAGFYRSKYKDSAGVQRHMLCTQFEAIDARRCFPCWDEPGRKAVFDVTLIYPSNLMALSNMPARLSENISGGRRREVFMPTPKMSTYLLAFCVGEFEFISAQTNHGTIARVFCMPGSLDKCNYALTCCVRALDFYNDFFGMPYPLPKLDMIAVPDFSAGAMENWGLVTYREVALLCDEQQVSSTQKQRICSVIAHELAHQWFGNLVTMAWWDDLWLNEGFANWMQTFASDALHPEWNMWESYVSMEQQQALNLDAMRSSHPIQVPIKQAEKVEEVFDAISYCKGGSVVRMVFAVLGCEKFQEGLRLYFKRHQYGNTETLDLWKAWSEVSGKPVDAMMESWTQQMGFPVLKVVKDPTEDGDGAEVVVEQRWFLADGSCESGDEAKKWFIPVLSGTETGATPMSFFEANVQQQKLPTHCAVGKAKWFKLNYGQHVPLRVLYPPSMLSRLVKGFSEMPAEDRIGLLSDSYALCKAGALEPTQLISVLAGFRGEMNDKVWAVLEQSLAGLDKVVGQGLDSTTAEAFTSFAAGLVTPAFQAVGWDAAQGEDDNKKKLRSILLSAVAKFCFKDEAIQAEAKRRLDPFLADPNNPASLAADIRLAVMSLVIRGAATAELFDRMESTHETLSDGAARIHMYTALGTVQSQPLRARALAWCLSDSVRSQDMIYIPASVAGSGKAAAEALFAWVQAEYDRIHARLGSTSMILFQHIVKISGGGFVTTDRAQDVERFWKSTALYGKVEKSVAQTVEGINSSAKFVERLRSCEAALKDELIKNTGVPRSTL